MQSPGETTTVVAVDIVIVVGGGGGVGGDDDDDDDDDADDGCWCNIPTTTTQHSTTKHSRDHFTSTSIVVCFCFWFPSLFKLTKGSCSHFDDGYKCTNPFFFGGHSGTFAWS